MRILYVASRFPSHIRTGDRLRVYYLVRELALAGHEVHLIGFDDTAAPIDTDVAAHCRTTLRVPFADVEFGSTRTLRNFLRFAAAAALLRPHRVERLRQHAMAKAVRDLLRNEACDVAHFSEEIVGSAFEANRDECEERGIPTVFDFIDVMSHTLARSADEMDRATAAVHRVEARLLLRYERRLVALSDAVTVVSADDREYLGNPPNMHVVPNGVDLKPPADETGRDIDILFVGHFESAANRAAIRWFLARVWPAILEGRPGVTLCIVGPNPPADLLARGSERISVAGCVPSTDEYYRRARLAVAPMQSGTGIKNKILEAFAHGVAVVATGLANRGIDAPAEAIVIEDDPGRMAGAVLALLHDPARRRRQSEAARAYADKHFNWEAAAQRYLQLYGELAASLRQTHPGAHTHNIVQPARKTP